MLFIFSLLILFQLKHFLADYPLQGKYMLGKFKDSGWVAPLSAHCGVHAFFTLCISLALVSWEYAIALACFDFVVHFIMDRVKASPRLLGRYAPTESKFWYALGFDQMVHHLTHYAIVAILIHLM